eukprot:PLAT3349.4.p1 GENE.PLAT3349.4~~PLAT3349.4.p1  ORF type:complete len:1901 (+),score=1104.94 PLAT3349.4:132-5705(+)
MDEEEEEEEEGEEGEDEAAAEEKPAAKLTVIPVASEDDGSDDVTATSSASRISVQVCSGPVALGVAVAPHLLALGDRGCDAVPLALIAAEQLSMHVVRLLRSSSWQAQLQAAVQAAGVEGQRTMLLVEGLQVDDQQVSGDVRALLSCLTHLSCNGLETWMLPEAALLTMLRSMGTVETLADSRTKLWEALRARCLSNLHIVFTAAADDCQLALPSLWQLRRCSSIDIYSAWTVEELTALAAAVLRDMEAGSGVAATCAAMHAAVVAEAAGSALCPSNGDFLHFLSRFKSSHTEHETSLASRQTGLAQVLVQKEELAQLLTAHKHSLEESLPVLEELVGESAGLATQLEEQTATAEALDEAVTALASSVATAEGELKALEETQHKELHLAEQAFVAGRRQLEVYLRDDILFTALVGMSEPPKMVKLVIIVAHLLVEPTAYMADVRYGAYWEKSLSTVSHRSFADRALAVESPPNVDAPHFRAAVAFLQDNSVKPKTLKRKYPAGRAMYDWARAMVRLAKAQHEWTGSQRRISSLEASMAPLREELAAKTAELQELRSMTDAMARHQVRLQEARGELETQVALWSQERTTAKPLLEQLEAQQDALSAASVRAERLRSSTVGDELLLAAMLEYLGPQPPAVRRACQAAWLAQLRSARLPHSGSDLKALMLSRRQLRAALAPWQRCGTPDVAAALLSALLVSDARQRKVVILLDDHGCAARLLRALMHDVTLLDCEEAGFSTSFARVMKRKRPALVRGLSAEAEATLQEHGLLDGAPPGEEDGSVFVVLRRRRPLRRLLWEAAAVVDWQLTEEELRWLVEDKLLHLKASDKLAARNDARLALLTARASADEWEDDVLRRLGRSSSDLLGEDGGVASAMEALQKLAEEREAVEQATRTLVAVHGGLQKWQPIVDRVAMLWRMLSGQRQPQLHLRIDRLLHSVELGLQHHSVLQVAASGSAAAAERRPSFQPIGRSAAAVHSVSSVPSAADVVAAAAAAAVAGDSSGGGREPLEAPRSIVVEPPAGMSDGGEGVDDGHSRGDSAAFDALTIATPSASAVPSTASVPDESGPSTSLVTIRLSHMSGLDGKAASPRARREAEELAKELRAVSALVVHQSCWQLPWLQRRALALRIMMQLPAQELTADELRFLLLGELHDHHRDVDHSGDVAVDWMPPPVWQRFLDLTRLPRFASLRDDLRQAEGALAWRAYAQGTAALPERWAALPAMLQLLIVRCFHEQQLLESLRVLEAAFLPPLAPNFNKQLLSLVSFREEALLLAMRDGAADGVGAIFAAAASAHASCYLMRDSEDLMGAVREAVPNGAWLIVSSCAWEDEAWLSSFKQVLHAMESLTSVAGGRVWFLSPADAVPAWVAAYMLVLTVDSPHGFHGALGAALHSQSAALAAASSEEQTDRLLNAACTHAALHVLAEASPTPLFNRHPALRPLVLDVAAAGRASGMVEDSGFARLLSESIYGGVLATDGQRWQVLHRAEEQMGAAWESYPLSRKAALQATIKRVMDAPLSTALLSPQELEAYDTSQVAGLLALLRRQLWPPPREADAARDSVLSAAEHLLHSFTVGRSDATDPSLGSMHWLLAHEWAPLQQLHARLLAECTALRDCLRGPQPLPAWLQPTFAALAAMRTPASWLACAPIGAGDDLGEWTEHTLARMMALQLYMHAPPVSWWLPAFADPLGLLSVTLAKQARRMDVSPAQLTWRGVLLADRPGRSADRGLFVHGINLRGGNWDSVLGALCSLDSVSGCSPTALWLVPTARKGRSGGGVLSGAAAASEKKSEEAAADGEGADGDAGDSFVDGRLASSFAAPYRFLCPVYRDDTELLFKVELPSLVESRAAAVSQMRMVLDFNSWT